MFHVFFALNRGQRSRMNFEIYKLMDVVSLRESGNESIAVLIHASNQVVCHADVDRPTGTACEDINVELPHVRNMPKRDGRDKPTAVRFDSAS